MEELFGERRLAVAGQDVLDERGIRHKSFTA